MKKASWIALTVAGVAITVVSLVSAGHAYNKRDERWKRNAQDRIGMRRDRYAIVSGSSI